MPKSIKEKPEVVVITGASAGVGRAVAERFAKSGAHIGLLARGTERLAQAKADVETLGGKALTIPMDIADPDQVEVAAKQVENAFGPIDIWINNAMESVFSPAKLMTPEEFKRVTEVTYLGAVYGTLSALKRMQPRNRGTILMVGSALGYRGIPLQSAYCAGKHAMKGFMESVRCELIHDRSDVKLCMAVLPAVNTPQFEWVKSRLPRHPQPVPPIFQPEVIAEGIYWLAHHPQRELFIGASSIMAVWGNRILPGFVDWYLGRTCYDRQQTSYLPEPGRQDNLWAPAPGNFGAHGDFDDRANNRSLQLWGAMHKKNLLAAALILGGLSLASRYFINPNAAS